MLAGNPATAVCFQQPKSVDSTHLNLFQFHVDFANPNNSSFTGPSLINVAPFSELCAKATDRACIPHPSPREKVDPLAHPPIYRRRDRHFAGTESLVAPHRNDAGAV